MPEMSADSRGESGFKFDSRDAIGRQCSWQNLVSEMEREFAHGQMNSGSRKGGK